MSKDADADRESIAGINVAMGDIVDLLEKRDKERGTELAKALSIALREILPKLQPTAFKPDMHINVPAPVVKLMPAAPAKTVNVNLRIGVVPSHDGTAKTYVVKGTVSQ